jgi:hypothetical protein
VPGSSAQRSIVATISPYEGTAGRYP